MIETVTSFLLAHPGLTYALAFFGAFLESTAFVGIFIPGSAIIIIGGALSEQWPGTFHFGYLYLLALLGTFLGNAATYLMGRYYGPPFFSEQNFYLKRQYLTRANNYFEAHGGKSIFTSQFLGPLRSLVPLVAGMAEMSALRFIFWTAAGGMVWAFLNLALGYLFGASWEAINLWGTRLTIFVLAMVALGVLNWLIGRFLVRHERQARTIIYSVGQSILAGFLGNEYVAALINRYPKFFSFFKNRFTRRRVLGLPFTLAVLISLFILSYLLLLIHAIVTSGPLLDIDQRLLAAAIFIRDPLLNKLVLMITNLAGPLIIILAAAVALLLWLEGRDYRLTVFVIGSTTIYYLQLFFKYIFSRARPDQSVWLVSEPSPSFPSAHAVMATVIFGFALFVLLKSIKSWRLKIASILSVVTVVFLIGFSRVYLGVHWTSDVLGGYLLGNWWLVIMLTAAHIGEHTYYPPKSPRVSPGRRWLYFGCQFFIYLLVVVWLSWQQPLRTIEHESISILPKIEATSFSPSLLKQIPGQTETLFGHLQAPINLIFVGSQRDVEQAFRAAGWEIADPLSVSSTLRIIQTTIQNQPYPTAPFSPQFYEGRVQDIGWQKGTDLLSARQRHHVRLWLAPLNLHSGESVWLGSASFDEGVAYSSVTKFPTHIISPDLDSERNFIVEELNKTGHINKRQTVQLNNATLGKTGAGSPFFTDGRAEIIWLSPTP